MDQIDEILDMYYFKRKTNIFNIYDLNELQQYGKYLYINYNKIVVDSFI